MANSWGHVHSSDNQAAFYMHLALAKYTDEYEQLPKIMELIQDDLSEPYCIYTYRYFLHQWPQLCYLMYDLDDREDISIMSAKQRPNIDLLEEVDSQQIKSKNCVGVIISKCENHKNRGIKRGYIAMLAIREKYRNLGIASFMVKHSLSQMEKMGALEVFIICVYSVD